MLGRQPLPPDAGGKQRLVRPATIERGCKTAARPATFGRGHLAYGLTSVGCECKRRPVLPPSGAGTKHTARHHRVRAPGIRPATIRDGHEAYGPKHTARHHWVRTLSIWLATIGGGHQACGIPTGDDLGEIAIADPVGGSSSATPNGRSAEAQSSESTLTATNLLQGVLAGCLASPVLAFSSVEKVPVSVRQK